MKKGELEFSTIVIAVLTLLVLIVLSVILFGRASQTPQPDYTLKLADCGERFLVGAEIFPDVESRNVFDRWNETEDFFFSYPVTLGRNLWGKENLSVAFDEYTHIQLHPSCTIYHLGVFDGIIKRID